MTYPTYAEEEVNREFPALGIVSAWFGVIMVALTAVGYSLSSPLQPSKTEPLVDMLQFILVALILASVVYVFVRAGEGVKVTAVPLVINIGTLVILQLVPFAAIREEARYRYHAPNYQAVVQKVESGEWQPDASGTLLLPTPYRNLSADNGRFWIQRDGEVVTVFFLTEQQGFNQFAGYVYRSDGRPPQNEGFPGQWHTIIPKQSNWYFCVSG
ncbi:MAG TPA: hypothetical protein PLK31_20545 [Chloroflexota bacterium]|nr:hypothetical protein [Chloroflexota bacterium]